jgi:sugar-phosphatase
MSALHLPGWAILFDCDGVLVDSDASVAEAWTTWALEYDLSPAEVADAVHGRRACDSVDALLGAGTRRAATALERINQLELDSAATVTPVPGAAALIEAIPTGRWAVVTSGTRALATARLRAAGLALPQILITSDDVTQGKPAPEGYSSAAALLGVDPQQGIVVEDAVSGVRAARAADIRYVVGVSARALETDADVVVGDLTSVRWSDGLTFSSALRPVDAKNEVARRVGDS